jgi:hypothetical protein
MSKLRWRLDKMEKLYGCQEQLQVILYAPWMGDLPYDEYPDHYEVAATYQKNNIIVMKYVGSKKSQEKPIETYG